MLVITAASERAVHWMEARPCPRREHGVPVLLLALPGLLFLRLPPESAWWRQLHGSTAEASMWREDGLVVDDALASIVPDSGPPFEAATRWLAEAKQRTDRPNVLFLVIESLSRGHVGAYGYPRPVTPNIDAIAADGLAWEEIRSTSSLSSYAQLAILSSLDPRRGPHLQTYTNLDYPRVLLHDALVPLGWRAGVISSQNEDWGGMRRFLQTGTPLDFWDVHDHPGPYMGEGGDKKVPDRFTIDEAITWTAREPGRPWALYVNLQRTHYPYHPPETPGPFQPADPGPGFAFLSWPSSQREAVVNRYDNALLDLDTQIGRLVGELQRRGDWDRTLVVLTSDHGELLEGGERVGHGKFLDEEELRVPLILRLRGRLAVGRSAVPGSHLDVLPTVARLLGLPPHPAWQGTSLLDPERPRSRPIFATLQGLKNVDVVLCWPRKLVADWNGGHAALHDLRVDPGERQDLAAAQPEVTDALSLLLARHITSQVRYHEPRDSTRQRQFAPRLLDCPAEP
jgi:hypothetical protein